MKTTLPADWEIRTVKELGHGGRGTVQTGPFGAQLHAEDYVEDGVPLILIRNLKDGSLDLTAMPKISGKDAERLCRYSLNSGDVVFSRVGRVGSCFLANADHVGWLISGQLLRVRISDCEINSRYLYRALTSKYAQDHIRGESVGTTRTSINTQILESLPLLVPTSKSEQSKIADVLSAVDQAIEQTEALIAKEQRIKTGLMQDLLARGIDEHGNLRSEQTHKFKDSPLGRIPVEWGFSTLEAIGRWASGGTPSKANPNYWGDEVPWLCPKDMKTLDIDSTIDRLTQAGVRHGSTLMPEKTVFIVVRGMILAHTFPVSIANRPMAFNQDVKGIVAGPTVEGRFLAYWLLSQADNFLKLTTTATHGTKRFDMNELFDVVMPIPEKLEQTRVVTRLDTAEEQVVSNRKIVRKLRSLKTGLMQDLLTGRRRVTALLEPEPKREKIYVRH